MSIADAPAGLSPLARRFAEVAHRVIVDLDLPTADVPYAIAVRQLADDEIRAALAAVPLLAELDRRHQWRVWDDGTSRTCTCGHGDCDVRDLLDQTPP